MLVGFDSKVAFEFTTCCWVLFFRTGVGKLRKEFLPGSVGGTGMDILRGLKKNIDPKNIFANGNLL